MRDQHLQNKADQLIKEIPDITNVENLPNIYFVGKAGSGKTYSAKFMIKKYGFEVAKFAYPVYMIAEKYFGMKEKNRRLLQIIGTESARDQINSEIWVERFKEDMTIVRLTSKILNLPLPKFVMDDCRFPNEHKILQELGFVGIYIDVSDEKRKFRLVGRDGTAQENTLNHSSETLIDTFKDELVRVDGNGELEESYVHLNDLLQSLATKEESFKVLDTIKDKLPDVTDEEVEKDIDDAIHEVRKIEEMDNE